MQEAIPYRTHAPTTLNHQSRVGSIRGRDPTRLVRELVKEKAVIVIGRRGCCMSHVAERLLQGLGANPAVYEVEEGCEDDVAGEICGGGMEFPAVFIGGRWFGGLERVMASHITGELTPLLKQAGALWL